MTGRAPLVSLNSRDTIEVLGSMKRHRSLIRKALRNPKVTAPKPDMPPPVAPPLDAIGQAIEATRPLDRQVRAALLAGV